MASILILLSSVCAKYPGDATVSERVRNNSEEAREGHTIGIKLAQALALCKAGGAGVESVRAKQGHDLKVSVRPQRGARAAVVQRAQPADELGWVGDISCRRIPSQIGREFDLAGWLA